MGNRYAVSYDDEVVATLMHARGYPPDLGEDQLTGRPQVFGVVHPEGESAAFLFLRFAGHAKAADNGLTAYLVQAESSFEAIQEAGKIYISIQDGFDYHKRLPLSPLIHIELAPYEKRITGERQFYILFAALTWENQQKIITEQGIENIALLRSPSISVSYQDEDSQQSGTLYSSKKRAYSRHLKRRIEIYYKSLVASKVRKRMKTTIQIFKTHGYRAYYAGQEGIIRERLLALFEQQFSKDIDKSDILNEKTRLLAAYYMAYTDYLVWGVPNELIEYTEFNKNVFISHSRKDENFAKQLYEDLANNGFSVWLDAWELRFGDSLWDKIGEGISKADYLLVLLSPRSVESPWVRKEYNAGLSIEMERNTRFVIPILYENVSIPTFLKEKFYCDMSIDYERQLLNLVKSIDG